MCVLGGVVHRWYRVLGGVVRRWYCRQWAGRVPSLVAWLTTFSAIDVRLAGGGSVALHGPIWTWDGRRWDGISM